MYENMTFPFILQRMLDGVAEGTDKREGSVIYDALAPCALELAMLYARLDAATDEAFADTAGREMLLRRAAERGLSPRAATFAAVRGEFNVSVPEGARFSSGDLRYRVAETLADGGRKLVCESAGSEGNRASGALVPLDYIDGLTRAEITALLTPGEDDEDTERFRKRFFDSLQTYGFGGNVADYREKALRVPGVGGVKVYPVWNGGGTVKLVIRDYLRGVPSEALVNEVQNAIDPEDSSGTGEGCAPIGHRVTVAGVTGFTVNISAVFVLTDGWEFSDALPYLNAVADDYFGELAATWESSERLTVPRSRLEARLLDAGGVEDVINLRINGAAENILLPADCIPLRGDIVGDD
jgi:uncharacterized phage protein gp47/JayE